MKPNSSLGVNIAVHFLFAAMAYFFISSFGYTMLDDGWRHMAMAFDQEQVKSWGNLFLNSLYKEYDPWFMWHILLQKAALIVSEQQVPILINSIVYFLLSAWFFAVFNAYSKLNIYFKILLSIGLPLVTIRYYYLRPDVLSGFFLLSIVLIKNNKLILALLSLIYMPFYYIFWFYMGYLGFIKLILKEYKALILLIVLTLFGFAFHLNYDYEGYLHMMGNVLNNDKLIGSYAVTESQAFLIPDIFRQMLGSGKLLLLLMLISLLCWYLFKPQEALTQYMLLFTPLMLVQYRFFHLLEPLVMVYFIIMMHRLFAMISEHSLAYVVQQGVDVIKKRSYLGSLSSKVVVILLFASLTYFFTAKYFMNIKGYAAEARMSKTAQEIFQNEDFKDKKIFLTAMNGMLFRAIYYNPSGQYMPNCSIGWVDFEPKMKDIYFKILTKDKKLSKNDLFEFLKINNFDIFIIIGTNSENMGFTAKEIEKNGYYFEKIISGNLIFKRKIKKNKL